MESAQKRAILAILGMIESGIQQLRIMLSADDSDSHVIADAPRPSAETGYISPEEEQLLEDQLESERQRMLKFEQRRAETLWKGHLDEDDQ